MIVFSVQGRPLTIKGPSLHSEFTSSLINPKLLLIKCPIIHKSQPTNAIVDTLECIRNFTSLLYEAVSTSRPCLNHVTSSLPKYTCFPPGIQINNDHLWKFSHAAHTMTPRENDHVIPQNTYPSLLIGWPTIKIPKPTLHTPGCSCYLIC